MFFTSAKKTANSKLQILHFSWNSWICFSLVFFNSKWRWWCSNLTIDGNKNAITKNRETDFLNFFIIRMIKLASFARCLLIRLTAYHCYISSNWICFNIQSSNSYREKLNIIFAFRIRPLSDGSSLTASFGCPFE